MTYRVKWGQNLQAARHRRNLTQEQVARQLNVGMIQVSRWERGATVPRDTMKVRLAEFYGVSVSALFPWDGNGAGEAVA
jgi:transcriptional regulator with XRE-family HTH domain